MSGTSKNSGKPTKPTHYKVICLSLYTRDQERLAALVAEMKERGITRANKSLVVRIALAQFNLEQAVRAADERMSQGDL